MKWKRNDSISNEEVVKIAKQVHINPILARILLNRGFSPEAIRIITQDFHNAVINPKLLTNAVEAADVITDYCKDKNATICIYGDYDADGVDSNYVLSEALKEVASCKIHVHYPERHAGYGLSMDYCKEVVKQNFERCLVITIDNGITKIAEIDYLKKHGIEVIVLDHHVAKAEVPDCLIVDPHNNNEPDTYKHLCGCGVGFKVAQLVQRNFGVYNMLKYTPYLAIATLGDSMPLTAENIAFVQYGLILINSEYCPKGIKLMKKFLGKEIMSTNDLIWDLVPRINACGRMGQTWLAAELFNNDNEEELEEIVNQIEALNIQRKEYTDQAKAYVETLDFSNDKVCILDMTGYPEGVIGIVAGKVVERFNKPAIVVAGSGTELKGSSRTVNGVNLQTLLQTQMEKGNVISFGGHDAAAGVKVSADKIEDLKTGLNAELADVEFVNDTTNDELLIDEIIELIHVNEATYKLVNAIPFDNKSIKAPTFALIDVEVKAEPTKKNPKNAWLHVKQGNREKKIWINEEIWNKYKAVGSPSRAHIAASIELNFMDKKSYTLKIVDFMEA